MIRIAKKEDLVELAKIYGELYNEIDLGERWSTESAKRYLEYWLEKQNDLFFVAEEDGNAVGGIVSIVKPWFDGNRLFDTELFVSPKYQHKHLGSLLLKRHLSEAIKRYNCTVIEFHTYGSEQGFPQNWYYRIGCKKDEKLTIMKAKLSEVAL